MLRGAWCVKKNVPSSDPGPFLVVADKIYTSDCFDNNFPNVVWYKSYLLVAYQRAGERPHHRGIISSDDVARQDFSYIYHRSKKLSFYSLMQAAGRHCSLIITLYSSSHPVCAVTKKVTRTSVCVCFLPIHSGHQVRWTYQPGSHRRKVTQVKYKHVIMT